MFQMAWAQRTEEPKTQPGGPHTPPLEMDLSHPPSSVPPVISIADIGDSDYDSGEDDEVEFMTHAKDGVHSEKGSVMRSQPSPMTIVEQVTTASAVSGDYLVKKAFLDGDSDTSRTDSLNKTIPVPELPSASQLSPINRTVAVGLGNDKLTVSGNRNLKGASHQPVRFTLSSKYAMDALAAAEEVGLRQSTHRAQTATSGEVHDEKEDNNPTLHSDPVVGDKQVSIPTFCRDSPQLQLVGPGVRVENAQQLQQLQQQQQQQRVLLPCFNQAQRQPLREQGGQCNTIKDFQKRRSSAEQKNGSQTTRQMHVHMPDHRYSSRAGEGAAAAAAAAVSAATSRGHLHHQRPFTAILASRGTQSTEHQQPSYHYRHMQNQQQQKIPTNQLRPASSITSFHDAAARKENIANANVPVKAVRLEDFERSTSSGN